MVFRIFAWFGSPGKLRDPACVGEEIDINRRMRTWASDLSTITGPLRPDQDTAIFFPGEMGRGRLSRPPYAPYVITDSIARYPWLPSGEPHAKAPCRQYNPRPL